MPYVGCRVKGRAANQSTSYWTYGWYNIYVPNRPEIKVELGTWPSATFNWEIPESSLTQVDVKTTGAPWFTRLILTSVLVKDSAIENGADIDWNTTIPGLTTTFNGTTSSSTRYENTFTSETGSFVVAEDSSQISKNKAENGYAVKVDYNSPISVQRPMDTVETEYKIAVPNAGVLCPDGNWSTGSSALAVDNSGGSIFTIDDLVGEDECLFVRVNSVYDGKTTYGEPMAIDFGKLATPTSLSATPDATTHKVTITAKNESDVPDSFLVVRYMTEDNPNGFDIGVSTTGPGNKTITGIQCPVWTSTPRFGVYAVAPAGCYTTKSRGGGVTGYIMTPTMKSDLTSAGGTIPEAPASVSAVPTKVSGTVLVSWAWSWADADGAEISWADHDDAWESTDEPNTYDVTKLRTGSWNVSGLHTGIKWYFRVRLFQTNEETRTYGAYSSTVVVDLASAPHVPVLTAPVGIITEDGQVDVSWVYSTTDGTGQAAAEIAEVTIVSNNKVYTPIAQTQTAQHITLSAAALGWQSGETHTIVCRVRSASGVDSDGWSNELDIAVAEPIECDITATSLETVSVPSYDQDGEAFTRSALSLTEMPMTATVEGAGDYGTTTLTIVRDEAYYIERPDETDFNGYAGETIYTYTQQGEAQITVNLDDLIGHLDDGASYKLIATVQDGLGQTSTESINFEVHWEHQPAAPTATVTISNDLTAILSPIAPTGAAETDVCDIYRLSIDKPVLVYEGATFGESYLDPRPTIGSHGGYRFVTRTVNGDYITAQNRVAWKDYTGGINVPYNIIDFGDDRIELEYDIELDTSWEKNFKMTEYLGGSVQGDWTKAIKRSGTLGGDAIVTDDIELIQAMRRLAEYPGICHIRTKDGSNYTADIQVQEKYTQGTAHKIANFTLKVTRVDSQEQDGIMYEVTS